MLSFIDFPIKCANLGTPNAIPDFKTGFAGGNPPKAIVDEGMDPIEGAWVSQGNVHCMLPYTMIDGYDRDIHDSTLRMAVLENEYLRASFALDLGGRLWNLYDKKQERELLFENHVFQPANLALRNAWFSGGVEWNIGIIGHHPYTCSPMFVSHYDNAEGGETLRMYEFERKRGLVYSVRATLAKDVLLVRVTIENPQTRPTYVYWWSNMAVEQHEKTRIIVPALNYYTYEWKDGKSYAHSTPVPDYGYYPARHNHAYDYFFRIPKDRHKFEAAVDEAGDDGVSRGFVQFSTDEQIGRKLFVWGTETAGGRNWNRWLSHDDRYYAETQAGLLHSQAEQAPMPAGAVYEWTEGYSSFEGAGYILHNPDYRQASNYTENKLILSGRFDLVNNADKYFEAKGEEKIFSYGSGWGALTEMYTGKKLSKFVEFPKESIADGTPESDFAELWQNGVLPEKKAALEEDCGFDYAGGAYGGYFLDKLQNEPVKSWYSWLEMACVYYEARSFDAAENALRLSIMTEKNPLALMSLAKMTIARGNDEAHKAKAIDYVKQALECGGEYVRLVIDALAMARSYGTAEDVESILLEAAEAHPSYLKNGRIALMYIQNLVKQGRLDEARERLDKVPEVSDIREGEVSTSEVWTGLYRAIIARDENRAIEDVTAKEALERYPVPAEIDFRMN